MKFPPVLLFINPTLLLTCSSIHPSLSPCQLEMRWRAFRRKHRPVSPQHTFIIHRSSYEDLKWSSQPIGSLITLKSTRANRLFKLDLNKVNLWYNSFMSLIESSFPPHKKKQQMLLSVPVHFQKMSGAKLAENMGNYER